MTNSHNHKDLSRSVLDKVVINAGVGRASQLANFSGGGGSSEDKTILAQIMRDLSAIAGQKPQVRRARKSIAGFKIREDQIVGLRVTLRRRKMVDFLTRLFTIVLPRVRDFNGLKTTSVDGGGVLNVGFRDQYVFPEINPEESPFAFSLGVNLVPKGRKREKVMEEYRVLQVPFKGAAQEREPRAKSRSTAKS